MKINVLVVLFTALAVSPCIGLPARRNVDLCECLPDNAEVCQHRDQSGKTLPCINKMCKNGTEPAWKTSDETYDCIECRPCSSEKMQLSDHDSCEMTMCSEGPLMEPPGKDLATTTYHPTTVLPDATVLQTSHGTSEDRTTISDQHTTSVSVQTASSSWIIIVVIVLLFLVFIVLLLLYCLHRRGCHPVSDWINLLPCWKKPNSSGQNAGSGREMTPLARTSNNND